MSRLKCKRGFTMIELLQVMVIMGILFGLVLTAVRFIMHKAKRQKAISACRALASGIRSYRYEYGMWPTDAAVSGSGEFAFPDLRQYMDDNNKHGTQFINWEEYPMDSQGYPIDSWMGRFVCTIDFDNDTVQVKSPGADETMGTGDDIKSGEF